MEIKISIQKKHFYILSFLLLAAIVVGYGTNNPPVFGHSGNEVDVNVLRLGVTPLEAIINNAIIPILVAGKETTLQSALSNGDIANKNHIASVGVAVGSYVGNGQRGRIIPISSKTGQPKSIWVSRTDGRGMPFYRINNMVLHDECGDQTERWCVVINPGANLLALEGSFKVDDTGDIHSTNKDGVTYEYIAFY